MTSQTSPSITGPRTLAGTAAIHSIAATAAAPRPSSAEDDDTAHSVLTFSCTPLEQLLQLPDFDAVQANAKNQDDRRNHHHPPINNNKTAHIGADSGDGHAAGLSRPSGQPASPPPLPPPPPPHPPGDRGATKTTPALSPFRALNPRKPSPGLAARLKALGFGAARKSDPPPPPHPDAVGRLPEEQLRKLDHDHQANSAAATVERRGRPWTGGAGATVRIPSRSSLRSIHSLGRARANSNRDSLHDHDADSTTPQQLTLPEMATTEPLAMDMATLSLSADAPPPPPPKDTPPMPQAAGPETGYPSDNGPFDDSFNPDSSISYFNPLGLQRPGSIYTLSRASFANQLAQLTSIQLPDADLLSSKVSAIPTAQAATRALINAAEQIRSWIHKASEVIGGLESEDDVEWAAAGGREGVEDVENAILRFEELINVYVTAIEELQCRQDIGGVDKEDLQRAVAQMEAIMTEWSKIRSTLRNIKGQVEIAMEWEELWNYVLGDIQNEMEELSRLVFEMEERRHRTILAATSGDNVDIGDLETIVEDAPSASTRLQTSGNRFSMPTFPVSPGSPSPASQGITLDDSSLLALFARMQPLRASLDFLPMRLSGFQSRADSIFPTSCEELEMRRANLDATYKKLERDAESLRKELGEDRWVLVFRGAGRQAQKMHESVERSVMRLKEALDGGMHLSNPPVVSKKIESYEAKKTHYGPAIERVLGIIDKGIKDRLTVNGEILRLYAEMQTRWDELREAMAELDVNLEDLHNTDRKGQHLRDSISSMLSNDRSTVASGIDTPQSSPPSSIIVSSLCLGKSGGLLASKTPKPRSPSTGSRAASASSTRRQSLLPTPASHVRHSPMSRLSTLSLPAGDSSPNTPVNNPRAMLSACHSSNTPSRPRWNSSINDLDTGHNFKPLTLTTPSPYAKRAIPTLLRSRSSLTPGSSPRIAAATGMPPGLDHAHTVSPALSPPALEITPSKQPTTTTRPPSFRDRVVSPGPYSQQVLARSRPPLSHKNSMPALDGAGGRARHSSLQLPGAASASTANVNSNINGGSAGGDSDQPKQPQSRRATTSLASGRRTNLLPQRSAPTAATTAATGAAAAQTRHGSLSTSTSALTTHTTAAGPGLGLSSGRNSPSSLAAGPGSGRQSALRRSTGSSLGGPPLVKDYRPRWRA